MQIGYFNFFIPLHAALDNGIAEYKTMFNNIYKMQQQFRVYLFKASWKGKITTQYRVVIKQSPRPKSLTVFCFKHTRFKLVTESVLETNTYFFWFMWSFMKLYTVFEKIRINVNDKAVSANGSVSWTNKNKIQFAWNILYDPYSHTHITYNVHTASTLK